MVEALIRVADKTNSNSEELNSKKTKRGDVIVVCDDGWPWSEWERTNPDWRVVRFPDEVASDIRAMVTPEFDEDSSKPRATLKARAFCLDLDDSNMAVLSNPPDGKVISVNLSVAKLRVAKVTKPKAKK